MSYNQGVLISQQNGPPMAVLTQSDPDKQTRNTYFANDRTKEKNITSINPYPDVFEGKRPIPIIEPLYDQHIIKPAKDNVTQGRIPFIEVISSCDRNSEHYPDPGKYQIKLKDSYTNVTSVTLFNACIPTTFDCVNKHNHLIYFQESFCEKLVAGIPEGNYTNEQLAEALQKALNCAGESNYIVTYSDITGKLTIKSDLDGGDHIFRLIFKDDKTEPHQYTNRPIYPCNSIGKVAGFAIENLQCAKGKSSFFGDDPFVVGNEHTEYLTDFKEGDCFYVEEIDQVFTVKKVCNNRTLEVEVPPDGTAKCIKINKGVYTGQYKVDLCPLKCISLEIVELENIRSNSLGVDRAFAVIPLFPVRDNTSFVLSGFNGHSPYVKYFNPPLARLDRFTVRFRDVNGNIVNFNGVNHLLEFKVKTINAQGSYDAGLGL